MEELIYKTVSTDQELIDALNVRRHVFVIGQNIDEKIVFDPYDDKALHIIVMTEGKTVGSVRLRLQEDGEAKLERMAILPNYRRKGLGQNMLTFLEGELRKRLATKIVLHAQSDVSKFYEKCGFSAEGPYFWEVGIKHIKMGKRL